MKRLICMTTCLCFIACSRSGDLKVSKADRELKSNPYKVERSFPEHMLEHRKLFETDGDGKGAKTYRVGDTPIYTVHVPGGWAGNVTFIDAGDQIIVYDTSVSKEGGEFALKEIRKITDKPIKTIFYSHHHPDHYSGAAALVDPKDVKSGKVTIYAWSNFPEERKNEFGELLPRQVMGAAYYSGGLVQKEDKPYFSCCGMKAIGGTTAFIPPTKLIDKNETLKIGNVELKLFYTGGEAISEFGIHIPKYNAVILADEFFYSIPNVHSIRTSKPRIPTNYITAIDRTLELKPDYLIGSHIIPMEGKEEIRKTLTQSRDAIQYLWDQSVRHINKGYDQMQLQEKLGELPAYLTSPPYNIPTYGSPKTMVPEFYTGWVSWFNGDAIDLEPDTREDFAKKIVMALGGRKSVLDKAEEAFNKKDYKFSGKLASYLVTINKDDMRARYLKASAIRGIAYKELNQVMRSHYLTSALELEGKINNKEILKQSMSSFQAGQLSDEAIFMQWRYKVDPEQVSNNEYSSCVYIKDTRNYWNVKVRNSVMLTKSSKKKNCDNPEVLTLAKLNDMNNGKLSSKREISSIDTQENNGVVKANVKLIDIYSSLDNEIPTINMSLK